MLIKFYNEAGDLIAEDDRGEWYTGVEVTNSVTLDAVWRIVSIGVVDFDSERNVPFQAVVIKQDQD